jgi:hypothetical protein
MKGENMPNYSDIQKEETLKARVFADYFDPARFAYEPNIGNIDFIITDAELTDGALFKTHYFWAEAKKGEADEVSMIAQLILTCKKSYDKGDILPPPFIGCFDAAKITFLPFHDILPIFTATDINWNAAPSDYLSDDFIKIRKKVEKLIVNNIVIFNFGEDKNEIKDFIKKNFISGASGGKSPITKNNFPHIYQRWLKEVKPSINISAERWRKYKREGVLDCDFFIADMMSKDGSTIIDRLQIILEKDNYKLKKDIEGELFKSDINFTDGGAAYRRFWNKYERPPAEEYRQYIIGRHDLLVPQNIREVKGSFFTPQIWVEKSQEYLEKAFGADWQDEYYVWDCAAGTGNLLVGLANKYNVWASDIDQPNVDIMHSLIDEGLNLLHNHVFQFDFLNDILILDDEKWANEQRAKIDLPPVKRKLPSSLCEIIDDPEKRKKLIVYINPPYAEAANYGHSKKGVSATKAYSVFKETISFAVNELFSQFFARIYKDIPDCRLASFGKLKYITASNFEKFRNYFKAEFLKGFICLANTFDNVKGNFPIGFLIWNLENKKQIVEVDCDVFDVAGNIAGSKKFLSVNKGNVINDWLRNFYDKKEIIGFLRFVGPDFQANSGVYITSAPKESDIQESRIQTITKNNVLYFSIYLAIRCCIEYTWLNDRDQFQFPNNGWEVDTEFQHDCFAFTLFHGQNRISSADGVNHWIPFTEKEVDAQEKFQSDFMSFFLKDKIFSEEARSVLDAGLALWKYYHAKIKGNTTVSVNASFYDIREFFQQRKENGTMNATSADETYNALIKDLRDALKVLAKKIEPKVYEYGFLKQ